MRRFREYEIIIAEITMEIYQELQNYSTQQTNTISAYKERTQFDLLELITYASTGTVLTENDEFFCKKCNEKKKAYNTTNPYWMAKQQIICLKRFQNTHGKECLCP